MALIQDQPARRPNRSNNEPSFEAALRKIASGFVFATILASGLLILFAVAIVYPATRGVTPSTTDYQDRLTNKLIGTIHQGAETVLPTDEAVASARSRISGGDFTLLVLPDIRSTKADSTVTYDVRVVRREQYNESVTISAINLPAGLTATADPAIVTDTEESATLRVTVAADAPEGNSSFNLNAKTNGREQSVPVNLTVTDVVISNIQLAKLEPMQQGSGWQATIAWTTDVPANTWVDYAPDSYFTANDLTYAFTNVEHTNTTEHSATLVYLEPNTVYHFRIRSVDAFNNLVVGSDRAFVTKTE